MNSTTSSQTTKGQLSTTDQSTEQAKQSSTVTAKSSLVDCRTSKKLTLTEVAGSQPHLTFHVMYLEVKGGLHSDTSNI